MFAYYLYTFYEVMSKKWTFRHPACPDHMLFSNRFSHDTVVTGRHKSLS
jgi:hypothetical protein